MAKEDKTPTETNAEAKVPIETKQEIVKDIEDKGKVPEEQAKAEEKIAEKEAAGESEKTIEESVKKDIEKAVDKVKEKAKAPKKEKAKGEAKPELEREYVIPLREKVRVVPRYKKTNKAVKTIKEFLARHMKIRDRDLNKIKLDTYLNEFLWSRGIRHPPHKVKVKAMKIGEIVRVELAEMPKKLTAKKARHEKIEQMSAEAGAKKKKAAPEKEEKKSEEDMKEEEEKKAAVVEAGQEMEKAQHKQMKHAARTPQRDTTAKKRNLQR